MNGSVSLEWHRHSWTCICKRDDCLRNDEIRPAAANAAQQFSCNVRWLHTICIEIAPVCFVENVRSGGLSRRTCRQTYYGGPPPSDATVIASFLPVLLYRPNGGAHSTACVRLSPELNHFLESDLVQLGISDNEAARGAETETQA